MFPTESGKKRVVVGRFHIATLDVYCLEISFIENVVDSEIKTIVVECYCGTECTIAISVAHVVAHDGVVGERRWSVVKVATENDIVAYGVDVMTQFLGLNGSCAECGGKFGKNAGFYILHLLLIEIDVGDVDIVGLIAIGKVNRLEMHADDVERAAIDLNFVGSRFLIWAAALGDGFVVDDIGVLG